MAMEYFLKIDGIPGESADSQHPDEIDVVAISWGMSQTGTSSTGAGGGSGKASFRDLQFVSRLNRASPLLLLACAEGSHIKEAVLSARKAGAQTQDFFEITLNDVIVAGIEESGDGVDVMQTVSLDYAVISYSYQRQRDDGSLEDAVVATWDLKQNKKV